MFDRARDARDGMETARRRYTTATVRQRLHQCAFRERVLAAYRQQCAFCRFRHAELLDAAHMLPDTDEGEPVVANGLALCKLHHAAFDRYFLGVRPDYIVQVRDDLLGETNCPTLVHGIQTRRVPAAKYSAILPTRAVTTPCSPPAGVMRTRYPSTSS